MWPCACDHDCACGRACVAVCMRVCGRVVWECGVGRRGGRGSDAASGPCAVGFAWLLPPFHDAHGTKLRLQHFSIAVLEPHTAASVERTTTLLPLVNEPPADQAQKRPMPGRELLDMSTVICRPQVAGSRVPQELCIEVPQPELKHVGVVAGPCGGQPGGASGAWARGSSRRRQGCVFSVF